MALIECYECGKEVSDQAHACPRCGFPVSEHRKSQDRDPDMSNEEDTYNETDPLGWTDQENQGQTRRETDDWWYAEFKKGKKSESNGSDKERRTEAMENRNSEKTDAKNKRSNRAANSSFRRGQFVSKILKAVLITIGIAGVALWFTSHASRTSTFRAILGLSLALVSGLGIYGLVILSKKAFKILFAGGTTETDSSGVTRRPDDSVLAREEVSQQLPPEEREQLLSESERKQVKEADQRLSEKYLNEEQFDVQEIGTKDLKDQEITGLLDLFETLGRKLQRPSRGHPEATGFCRQVRVILRDHLEQTSAEEYRINIGSINDYDRLLLANVMLEVAEEGSLHSARFLHVLAEKLVESLDEGKLLEMMKWMNVPLNAFTKQFSSPHQEPFEGRIDGLEAFLEKIRSSEMKKEKAVRILQKNEERIGRLASWINQKLNVLSSYALQESLQTIDETVGSTSITSSEAEGLGGAPQMWIALDFSDYKMVKASFPDIEGSPVYQELAQAFHEQGLFHLFWRCGDFFVLPLRSRNDGRLAKQAIKNFVTRSFSLEISESDAIQENLEPGDYPEFQIGISLGVGENSKMAERMAKRKRSQDHFDVHISDTFREMHEADNLNYDDVQKVIPKGVLAEIAKGYVLGKIKTQ